MGQLFFGWMSDHYSRKWALVISTIILFIFAAFGAGNTAGWVFTTVSLLATRIKEYVVDRTQCQYLAGIARL